MADPMRTAYERAFTGSNRNGVAWTAFSAGWKAATRAAAPATSADGGALRQNGQEDGRA